MSNMPSHSGLAVREARDAFANRARLRPKDPVVPFEFGVFDALGAPIDEARLRREWPLSKTINPTGEVERPARHVPGTSIYGGIVIGQYGHFLLETLSRCWYWRGATAQRVFFHAERPRLLPWQAEAFEAAGLSPERIALIAQSLTFERLVVPAPGYVISTAFHDSQRAALELRPHRPDPERRLWVSRSNLGSNALGMFTNEAELEDHLASAGWRIFHPQEHSFREQVDAFATASCIAGIEGSALHTIVHIGGFGGELRIIPRTTRRRLNSLNYKLIAETKALRQTVYTGALAQVAGTGAFGRLAIVDLPACLRFVHGPGAR
jgi:hypothetical protein